MNRFIDLTGKKYTKLIVTKYVGNYKYICECDCGNKLVVGSGSLRSGNTKSCGCLRKEIGKKIGISNKGSQRTKESRKNISEARKGKNVGENHPRWNYTFTQTDRQDIRKYPEYYEWRKAVYDRDNYTCQKCGEVSGVLNAHHIESYNNNNELRTTLENGITLCDTCHKDFHHQFGYGNNSRKQLESFLHQI